MGDQSAAILARNSISGKTKECLSSAESRLQAIPLRGIFISNTEGILVSCRYITRLKNTTSVLCLVVLCFAGGCGKNGPSVGGQYHIDQDGYGFGPGADKIILTLHGDKTFDVMAGPVSMLKGTWSTQENMLTFSGGRGAIVVNYRIEEKKLVPMKEGKEVTGWRWKQ